MNDPTQANNSRTRLLNEAAAIVTKDRNSAYGNPEDNFRNIAELWSTYLTASNKSRTVVTPFDVSQLMILMKVARLSTNPTHRDSLVDAAGYAACGADCQEALIARSALTP